MKKRFVLLIIAILLFIMSGCGNQTNQSTAQVEDMTDKVQDSIISDIKPVESGIDNIEEIEKFQNLTTNEETTVKDCEDLKENHLRQNCINYIIKKQALKDSNPNLCYEIEDEMIREFCIGQFPE